MKSYENGPTQEPPQPFFIQTIDATSCVFTQQRQHHFTKVSSKIFYKC